MKLASILLTVLAIIAGAMLALAIAALLTGCVAPAYDYDSAPPAEYSDDPASVCTDVGPCVGAVYCDQTGASEDPACNLTADYSCQRYLLIEGTDCFPTADITTGKCDGMGSCR